MQFDDALPKFTCIHSVQAGSRPYIWLAIYFHFSIVFSFAQF